MTIKYKIYTSKEGFDGIIDLDYGWNIPKSDENRYYQQFETPRESPAAAYAMPRRSYAGTQTPSCGGLTI